MARSWSRMVDMELDDEEKLDAVMPIAMPDRPDYPYGLRICLTQRELTKLGLEADCEIGDLIDIRAFGEVTSISKNDGPNGPDCRVEIQLQRLSLEDEALEDMDE
jgi:hypothetical protein